ncbi:DUF7544 domain-containing protein [Natrialba asiatica]|uniref:Glycerophosphoryl diester phosphodiesterase membrane domain-containing protein n=1 Tax=Natrialba asiatica (strain ATCC 700177 / DSM 12278 / JCM 9576 / FERM P-10747 / NBRC 102637 / 172P1) TaxID=29540 RepID=M0AQ40_NATA1|nr:hypothetical protein [Natrialba asiatica]ELZ00033.1 hypothetical protein C481_13594 [Natrialba asiatica DSM 12278]
MDAVDDLGDAIETTRALLLPVRVWLWLKLSIVVLFVGGSLGSPGNLATSDPQMVADEPMPQDGLGEIPDDVLAAIVVLAIVGILLWTLFALLGAIMEFVFIETLRSTEIHVRRYSRANLGRGIRLFAFRALVSLALLAVIAIPVGYFLTSTATTDEFVGELALIALVAIPLYIVYAIAMRFTSEFVAPIMLLEDRGVLGGWRRFWATLRGNVGEYVVYLLLVWILQLVTSIAVGFVVLFGAVVLAIPFVIVGVLAYALGGVGVYLAGAIGVVGLLALIALVALVQMPVRTYFQYYALLLLGDTDSELDLVPEQRGAARTNHTGAGETVRADERTHRPDDVHDEFDAESRDETDDYGWLDESGFRDNDRTGTDATDDRNDDTTPSDDRDDDADRGW